MYCKIESVYSYVLLFIVVFGLEQAPFHERVRIFRADCIRYNSLHKLKKFNLANSLHVLSVDRYA